MLNVGDKVIIKDSLDINDPANLYVEEMDKYIGKCGTIITVDDGDDSYEVEFEDGTDWWFNYCNVSFASKEEKVEEDSFEIGDKVKIDLSRLTHKVKESFTGGWVESMEKYDGHVGEIVDRFGLGYNISGTQCYTWDPRVLVKVEEMHDENCECQLDLKIGDKVRINLSKLTPEIEDSFAGTFIEELLDYDGDECTVRGLITGYKHKAVKVNENDWTWDTRVLELIAEDVIEEEDATVKEKDTFNSIVERYEVGDTFQVETAKGVYYLKVASIEPMQDKRYVCYQSEDDTTFHVGSFYTYGEIVDTGYAPIIRGKILTIDGSSRYYSFVEVDENA